VSRGRLPCCERFVARFQVRLNGPSAWVAAGAWMCLASRLAPLRVSGRAGSRTGRSPAASAVPQASLMRAARDPIMGRREAGGCAVVGAPQCGPRVRAAPGCGHPFGYSRLAGPEGMGRSACRQRDQSEARPRRRSGGQTWGRSRAARGRAGLILLAGPGTGRGRRAARRTRRRAAAGRRRSWRCCGPPCRGGR
jgi:hypothetical protein